MSLANIPAPLGKLAYSLAMVICLVAIAGCEPVAEPLGRLNAVWGRRGVSEGRVQKPRAIAIDSQDRIYLVDMTARVQCFTSEGEYITGWQTPTSQNGRPSGLSIARDGTIMVADTHYFRILFYTPDGKLLEDRTIGGTNGFVPGEFGFVTHCVQDSEGNYYISEYGEHDRIQKFSPDREYLTTIGGHGSAPGQFLRPQKMVVDAEDNLWVTDACNHRIQVFDKSGKLVRIWGEQGSAPGRLYYPYDLLLDGEGHVYVCEYGNHRVQKFTLDGKSLGCWGTHGRSPGQLHNPWGVERDSQGRIYVLDSNNHRVQRINM